MVEHKEAPARFWAKPNRPLPRYSGERSQTATLGRFRV
jgi:hypothetical protein